MWEDRKQTNSTTTKPNSNPNPNPNPNHPNPNPPSPLPPRNASPATSRVAVIGRNMLIIGKVHSSEDLYVDGEVRGALEAENCRLTIGPHGKASAGARAREVDVLGRIDGNVETQEKISIRNGGQLVGDIKAAGIVIEDGAYFKGSIDIIRRGPENGARKETA
ncbi:MAG TPA: polymer-forming cytoskeletal protein [Bryobacteraceae bacterium]|jgi:cytoskeletal protein CcmA (bactofilin family)